MAQQVCNNCGEAVSWEVVSGSGGWFVGTICHNDGCVNVNRLIDRGSHYYESRRDCETALRLGRVRWLANAKKHLQKAISN